MISDTELLRNYLDDGAEADFRTLVARRIDFVYASALRQVRGDPHLAEEVTQGVFLDLARKARGLARRTSVTGWLYTSTRFAAMKALRTRSRRLNRETQAHAMDDINATPPRADIAWTELRPVIDDVMHELNTADREAILQRYFEDRPLAEVGRTLGLSENSARMRVERALDKLRARLAQRGITSTAGALAVVLASQPVIAAPAGLAAATASASLAGAATGGAAAVFFQATLMNLTASKVGVGAACLLLCAAGIGVYQMNHARAGAQRETAALAVTVSEQTRALAALRAENNRLKAATAPGAGAAASRTTGTGRFSADELRQQVMSAFRAPNVTDAFMQLATVFQHISPGNWRGALQAFEEARRQGEDPGPAWELFVRRAGETVGKDAVEYFVSANDLASARLALTGWASSVPTEALGWIGKEASAETRTMIMGAAIRGLALTEPDLAVQAMEGIPIERRKEYVFDFATQLVRGAGMEPAGEIVNGMIRRAAAQGQGSDDYVKRIFGEYTEIKVRRAASSGDLAGLAEWVKTHVNQPYTDDSLVWGTAALLAQANVPRALAWLDTLHADGPVGEPNNPMGYGAALVTWANKDGPPAVARWLEANTNHPRYDHMAAQYAPFLAEISAEQARTLAGTIRNPAIRETALKKIAERGAKRQGT